MLALSQNSGVESRKPDGKKSNFSKKNYFQKNQSFNFRNKPKNGSNNNNNVNTSNDKQYLPKIRPSTSKPKTLTTEELALDGIIGGFSTTMPSIQNDSIRPLPKFLLYQPPTLDASDFLDVDQWDKENQTKMENLEKSTNDLTSLYEDFQKMRENERSIMEKKGLVDNENIRRSLEDAIIFKGTCHDMCPIYERIRRSVENDVRSFEKDENSNKISKLKAIKAFSRPAAGQPPPLPSDVRPPQILVKTLDYIVENILTCLPDCQSFLWDRTRSIRQDFTYQNYLGPEAADCNEKIVRIHILTLHIMAESKTEYSQQQELEQMNKALKTLSEMYVEYRSRGVVPPNEAEFRAYYLLSQIRDPELEREIQSLPIDVLKDEKIQLVLQLRNLISMNIIERGFQPSENVLNFFTTFFDLINNKKIPTLMIYLLEIHLNEIRFYSLKSMKKAIHNKAKPYSFELIKNLLAFNDDLDLTEFCGYYGILITNNDEGSKGIDILTLKHGSHIIPDQKPFRQSYSNKFNLNNNSYENLINIGHLNTSLIQFKDSSIAQQPIPSIAVANTSSAATPFSFQQPNSSFAFGQPVQQTSKTSAFSFAKPEASVNQLEIEKKKQQEIKRQEELRILKEKEERELKLKQIETEKVKKEQEELQKLKRSMLEKQELKKQKKIEIINSLSNTFEKEIISKTVKNEINSIVKPLVENRLEARQQRGKLIDAFSDGLFEAFVNELTYFESLNILSDMFRERQLKKKFIKKISIVAKHCENLNELKKRKREELIDVIENFGIPRIIKKKKIRNLSLSEISNISTSTSVGSIPTPKPENKINLRPFDLNGLIKNIEINSNYSFNILIYIEDSIISRLLNKKFEINENNEKIIKRNDKEIIKINRTNKINSNLFNKVNLLIFNLIEIKNFEKKRIELKELLQGIQLNNNYKFEILIIYWELDKDNLLNYNKKDILNEFNIPKNENILKVEFIKINSTLNLSEIEKYLNSINEIKLSEKGLFNEKYDNDKNINEKPIIINDNKKMNNNKFPSKFNVEEKYIKKFKPHIESSQKYKLIPKLLSDNNEKPQNNKFKIDVYSTPRPKSSELLQTPSYYDSSSISTFSNVTFETKDKEENIIQKKSNDILEQEIIIPKSIQELRDLTKKVKERHKK